MDISIDDRWTGFVEEAVQAGRFGTAGDVVAEGWRLVQAQEATLAALRAMVAEGLSDEDDMGGAEP